MDQHSQAVPKRWRHWLALIVIVGVFIGALLLRLFGSGDTLPSRSGFTVGTVPTNSTGAGSLTRSSNPTLGPIDAPVQIIEFSDFECPFCQQSYSAIRTLALRYPEKVRVVYRHFPVASIHPNAVAVAEAAQCAAAQGKFWPYHDRLFQNQSAMTKVHLIRYASQVGLSEQQFLTCIETRAQQVVVEEDLADGVRLGVRGTPTWFINGEKIEGALTLEGLTGVVEQFK
ncbi:MAG: DsbA family protein [Patescibacteria group bacterium]|jgi:protein-disulfide isomerase